MANGFGQCGVAIGSAMTLIDSNSLHNAAFLLGTVLFVGLVAWSVWFAFHMD